ncbi:P-loop containing nucleoside triphosphate hydrolase protein [Penicillium vulpinum]|uniref:P-loop containing nucleoside triphosphate hydrolase protein n=1 Tax=Penicillium vulpinum TaxID=29845 RepID=UPI00254680E2|nr:P-loop containing nucleoside triphosphate hydrolase protein [Penicillium vulpinum]KAJ5964053.1 P-loop containing nucleoside triphosphate hydrolase protein [Penicillium vulpinum]
MLLITSVCVDLAQATALHLTTERACLPSPFNVTLLVVKVVLLLLELKSKNLILREPWRDISVEETESFFNQTFYWSTNPTLRTVNDLLPLPKRISSDILKEKMKCYWENRFGSESRGKTCPSASNIEMHIT